MAGPAGDAQARVDALLREQTADSSPEEATYLLTLIANRAASELHRLTRQEASKRRESDEWGNWAALQNASRNVVLQTSTCRDLAARISGRSR